jgi:hypothetical protein
MSVSPSVVAARGVRRLSLLVQIRKTGSPWRRTVILIADR